MENIIKKFLGIEELTRLKQDQIKFQEKVDEILHTLECKENVSKYYFHSRKFFRDLQRTTINSSFTDMNKNIKDEINYSVNHYIHFYDLLMQDKCLAVDKILRELKST